MSDNFIIIRPWMVEELKLTGNRLVIFAIIYGFSRNGDWFQGSVSFLCKRSGLTDKGVRNVLKGLCTDGLIERKERPHKGMKYVDYRATTHGKNYRGEQITEGNKLPGGAVQRTVGGRYNVPTKVNIQNKDKVKNARTRKKYTQYQQRDATSLDYIEAVLTGKISTPNDKDSDEDICNS